MTSGVAHRTLQRLNVEPYSRVVFEHGLKTRTDKEDGEEHKLLDRAMEYAGMVRLEVADMLMTVNEKVHTLEPRVPTQHIFGGDGLQNFIHNHQDRLEHLEHQIENLTTMTNEAVTRLQVCEEWNHRDLGRVEEVNAELLRWVSALEHGRDNPIVIPDVKVLHPGQYESAFRRESQQ